MEASKEVEYAYQVKNYILRIQTFLVEAENNQRRFIITNDKSLLVPLSQTQKNIFRELDNFSQLTRESAEQQHILAQLKATIRDRFRILYNTIDNATNVQSGLYLLSVKNGDEAMEKFKNLSTDMDKVESKILIEKMKAKEKLEIATPKYLLLILLISFILETASIVIIIQANRRRKQYQDILETKIEELNNTNAEFEQIAFVASHDLQEPLRKIRTYSDKLIKQHKKDLHEDIQLVLDKMAIASRRMQELLNDLINYIRLSKNEEVLHDIDLNSIVESVCKNLANSIDQKKASFQITSLPVIPGFYKQLYLLFYNLIENSLKFAKTDVPPIITIKATKIDDARIGKEEKYFKITIADNGIGFQKEFVEKIFLIFQRLHTQNSAYLGKGIGLAICRRVMMNHKGIISAEGETGDGAVFHLYFPDEG